MCLLKLCLSVAMFALHSSATAFPSDESPAISLADVAISFNSQASLLLAVTSRTQEFVTLVAEKISYLFQGPKLTEGDLENMRNMILYFEEMSPQLTGELRVLNTAFAAAAKAFVRTMSEMNIYADIISQRTMMNTLMFATFEPKMRLDYSNLQTACAALLRGVQSEVQSIQQRSLVVASVAVAVLGSVIALVSEREVEVSVASQVDTPSAAADDAVAEDIEDKAADEDTNRSGFSTA